MLLGLLCAATDFIVLVTRLTTEELSDEQRMALIDQSIQLHGLGAACQFNLQDLLMILIAILIIIFWMGWKRAGHWPYLRLKSRASSRTPQVSPCGPPCEPCSNHSIFLPQNYGSPFNDTAEHITGLGLARIDFERCAVAGEVIYTVEGDSTPTSQQEEESRIATLAHALKKLGNTESITYSRSPDLLFFFWDKFGTTRNSKGYGFIPLTN